MPQFTDEHGVVVSYYVWDVPEPKGIVQLVHGLGDHATRYGALAAALNAVGYSVFADDHRGHGQTGLDQYGGDHSRLGQLGPGGLGAAVDDVHELSRIARECHPGIPLILLGHSWGSLMAQIIANRWSSDYDAIVLTGTAYRMPGSMAAGDFNKRHKSLGTTGYEWLSRDPEVSAAFLDDPLTFYADALKLFGVRDGLKLFGRPAKDLPTGLPVLIMIGDEDPLGGVASVRRLADAYRRRSGLTDVTVIVYPQARHEIFNETNRDEVVADLISWLDAHAAP
ncbi:alpha/beta fold hydrolase [Compostimonas suwonensis]|uniref:Alpha-beta hydrolase superfamily lysophospholipase n=1 Tax=Compostimonas suwonensis TaxID=1048394 RepID=A0A2M9C3P6_9MICO|nr:alpha/beta fold hydrolase [Compostimonas suwonensis]PJJ65132.1 alpha-beta hydrolase superfamily lysophospholipase [Compostimonas suwonensis]